MAEVYCTSYFLLAVLLKGWKLQMIFIQSVWSAALYEALRLRFALGFFLSRFIFLYIIVGIK